MSNEIAKVIHSKRLQQKKNYVTRQTKIAKNYNIDVDEPHRLQDHAALNCGIPKCIYCSNPRKLFKEKTIQEKRFDQTLKWE